MIPALLSGIAILLLVGFASGAADDDHRDEIDRGASKAAIERFWSIYHGNQYNAIPQVQAQLQGAIQHDPDNSTLYALLGATYFWHYGEYTRDTNLNLAVLQQDLPNAVSFFGKALDTRLLRQTPDRIYQRRPPTRIPGNHHRASQASKTRTIRISSQKATRCSIFAAYQFPEFNNFNRWAAHNTDARKTATAYKKVARLALAGPGCMRS